MAIFRSPSPFPQPLKFGHDRRRTSINPFLWRLMNRKGEHFSPSHTFTLPHAIKLTDRYVGCAPTDSLRHGSIYISYSPLFHPKSLISLHGLLWCLCGQACCICSALSLIGLLAIGNSVTVGSPLLVCITQLISNIRALWWLHCVATLAGIFHLLACSNKSIILLWYIFRQTLVYFPCRCSIVVFFFCAERCTDHSFLRVDAELINIYKL